MSQWGWNAIVLTPILDLAALSMLGARRRNRILFAGLAGIVVGLGAHIHLAAWIGGAGLGLWAVWPSAKAITLRRRALLGAFFLGGLLLATIPFLRDDPLGHYFVRVAQSSRVPMTVPTTTRAWWRAETAHAALTAPWWTGDLVSRHDLPGRFRLDWIVGTALAAALLRAVLTPRDELSAYLLASAAAGFLSTMAWGRGGTPNSYRYSYLSTTTALAAASGALWLLSAVPFSRRRGAAYMVMGGFAISGALGAREALLVWPEHRATFDGFGGWDTLVGQAAARWEPYGPVRVDPSIGGAPIVFENVRAFRLEPSTWTAQGPASVLATSLRIVGPGVRPGSWERVVERIRDGWGREYGQVLATRIEHPRPTRWKPTMRPGTAPGRGSPQRGRPR
jgi:hypothetical protein